MDETKNLLEARERQLRERDYQIMNLNVQNWKLTDELKKLNKELNRKLMQVKIKQNQTDLAKVVKTKSKELKNSQESIKWYQTKMKHMKLKIETEQPAYEIITQLEDSLTEKMATIKSKDEEISSLKSIISKQSEELKRISTAKDYDNKVKTLMDQVILLTEKSKSNTNEGKIQSEITEKQRIKMIEVGKKYKELQEKYNSIYRPEEKLPPTKDERKAEIDEKEIKSLRKTLKMERKERKYLEEQYNQKISEKDIIITETDREKRGQVIRISDLQRKLQQSKRVQEELNKKLIEKEDIMNESTGKDIKRDEKLDLSQEEKKTYIQLPPIMSPRVVDENGQLMNKCRSVTFMNQQKTTSTQMLTHNKKSRQKLEKLNNHKSFSPERHKKKFCKVPINRNPLRRSVENISTIKQSGETFHHYYEIEDSPIGRHKMMNFNNAQVKSEQISIIEHNEDGNWKNYNNSEKDAGTENEENITPKEYIDNSENEVNATFNEEDDEDRIATQINAEKYYGDS